MKAKIGTSVVVQEGRLKGLQASESPARTKAPARRSAEQRLPLPVEQPAASPSALRALLGVYADPQTWGAAFFILVSFVTGILYFTWAVTGLGLSISFLILIIGLPFAYLFLLSVRGLAMVEARLVQASLGVDLTVGPVLPKAGSKWLERLKALVTARSTWSALLYMFLQLPLGVIYFSVTVTLVALALSLISAPILYGLIKVPVVALEGVTYGLPAWGAILIGLAGLLLLTAAMHVIRGIGRWHAKYARALLSA